MDLIVRNARLSSAPEEPPVDIGIAGGRIVAIEPHLSRGCRRIRCGWLPRLSWLCRNPHPSRQILHHRPLRAGGRPPGQCRAARRRGEARLHGRGRLCPRVAHAGEVHQARHDPDAHAPGTRCRGGDAQLRGDRGVAARLRLGHRHRDLRLPAGRADQQSPVRTACSSRRCGAACGWWVPRRTTIPIPPARSTASSRWPASSTRTSTCIWIPATRQSMWISIWSAN